MYKWSTTVPNVMESFLFLYFRRSDCSSNRGIRRSQHAEDIKSNAKTFHSKTPKVESSDVDIVHSSAPYSRKGKISDL